MNGLDFLDKINDIDDDLLVLEKPAKVTNLRLRTTIISLCAAAGVFLIIGSVLLIPRFMNKGGSAISTVRSGGSDNNGSKNAITDAEAAEATTTAASEETGYYEDDNDASSEQENEQNSGSQQSSEQDSESVCDKDSLLYKGDVMIVNNDNNISDDEGYDYLLEVSESVSDSGISFSDPATEGIDFSLDGFCILDVTDEPFIDVGYRYYLQYSDDSIISLIAITKNVDDFKYQKYIYKWLGDLYDYLEEHNGEDVVFLMDGEDLYCIAPDNSYYSSNKYSDILADKTNIYSTYKFDENTYHVDI